MEPVDVLIIGGGVSGSATALLLKRRLPESRIVIVEKTDAFDRKVGESTVEISSFFLVRILKLYDYLSREQLTKQGFRYWFTSEEATTLRAASEVGPRQLARTPSFQLDRQKLDEDLLAMARDEGVEVWRPARVADLEMPEDGSPNRVEVERGGERFSLLARWIVDASGRATFLARRMGTKRWNAEHPTSAIWARLKGVRDLDGVACSGVSPDDPWFRAVPASRRLATNHFVGYGYWWWFIPLKNGDTSVGIVWDKRFVSSPEGDLEERFWKFASRNPLVSEMLTEATLCERDIRTLGHLPYFVDRACGRGWALVGDAAGFLDPFYSPGLDHLSFSAMDRVALIEKDLRGGGVADTELEESNRAFRQYFHFFFEAIYKDKYEIMGDYDLMTASFLLDTSSYYFVAVWPAYKKSAQTVRVPPFGPRDAIIGFLPIRFFTRRLVRIAHRRKELGTYGKRNARRRPKLVGFSLGPANFWMFALAIGFWLRAEIENAASYLRPDRLAASVSRFAGSVIRDLASVLPPPEELGLPPLSSLSFFPENSPSARTSCFDSTRPPSSSG